MPRAILAILAAIALLAVAAPTASQGPETAPNGLRLAFGTDAAGTVTVTFSGPLAQEAIVELSAPEGSSRTVEAEPHELPGDDEVGYRANVTGLEPGTLYTYQAVLDGQASEAFAFRTAPAPGADDGVRLTMFADQGVPADSPLARYDGDAPIRNMELARSMAPTAHLIAGDVSYANGDPSVWDVYFEKNQPLLATVPTMTVPGNHEREPGQGYAQYDARLTMPEPHPVGRWWTSQVGNVQVVGVNSDTACAESQAVQAYPIASWSCAVGQEGARQPNERQFAFLTRTLEQASSDPTVDWIVVMHHNPVYSTGPHGSNADVQALWMPVYEEHGVDLVLTGDDHFYQRTKTLVGGGPSPNGTVYIVNGAGGGEAYTFRDEGEEPPDWEASRYNDEYGTLVLETAGDRLEGRFVDLDGTVIDPFVLAGGADGTPHLVDPADTEASGDPPEGSTGSDGGSQAKTPVPAAGVLLAVLAIGALLRRARSRC